MVLQNAVEDEVILLVLLELVELLLHLVQHQVHGLHPLLQPGGLRLHLQKLGFVLSPLNMEVKSANLQATFYLYLLSCDVCYFVNLSSVFHLYRRIQYNYR